MFTSEKIDIASIVSSFTGDVMDGAVQSMV